jgi:hypothetical protein
MSDHPIGQLGSVKFKLASWVPAADQYQRRYLPVDFESEAASGDTPGLEADPKFRGFAVRSWRGGEGITYWDREGSMYRESTNVRPVSILDGLILGADQDVTVNASGGATFNDGSRFGYGLGSIWVADDGDGYKWTPDWGAAVSTGAVGSDVTSLTDGDDTFMYSGHESGAIWRWKSGSSEEHFDTTTDPFTYPPVVRSYEGVLYALDGDDLYEIDKTTPDTRTQVGDPANGSSAVFLADTTWPWARMSLSDKGPIWVQRLDNGQTFLWQYHKALDFQEIIGKAPQDFIFPYSVFFTKGYSFVAYRVADKHANPGDAYIWYKRGGQDGVIGPFRSTTGTTASKPILIGGMIGDDMIVYFDGAVWAYNFTDGAVYQWSAQTSTGTPEDCIVLGNQVFITPVNVGGGNTAGVERFRENFYTTETATIDLGKHDWDYRGLLKTLIDVTVITDPLPADTSVQVAYSADGATFVTVSGTTHDVDGETRVTFPVSTSDPGVTVIGFEFELRLILSTTDNTATPTVREVSARAVGASAVLEVIMILDAGNTRGQESHKIIDDLNGLRTAQAVVEFKDPFQNRDKDETDDYDVVVAEVFTPVRHTSNVEEEGGPVATVRVRGRELV